MQLNRLPARIRKYDFNPKELQAFDGDFAAFHEVGRLCIHGFYFLKL